MFTTCVTGPGNAPATETDIKRNKDLDGRNLWGERAYFWNCHRDGGDFAWHTNNVSTATSAPTSPRQITAAWTFDNKWNPEKTAGPRIRNAQKQENTFVVTFNENITVKGKPRLKLGDGKFAEYASGSGTGALVFNFPAEGLNEVIGVDFNGGAIIASEASAFIRYAELAVLTKEGGVSVPRAY